MERVIKFRAFSERESELIPWEELRGLSYLGKAMDNVLEGLHVMQFIGLTDRSGSDIYGGDIVHNHSSSVGKSGTVSFSDIHHAWIITYPRTHQDNWSFMHGDEHNFEVVGNIYENPELLSV